ncbi:MAG: hypothetical protein ACOCQP_01825 [Lentisphaeria bacterium]
MLFLFLILAVLNISGCQKNADEPGFSYLRSQLLTALFESIQAGDTDTAIKHAERLQVLFGEEEEDALNSVIRRVRNRALSNRLNSYIIEGKPRQALKELDRIEVGHRSQQIFTEFEEVLEDIQALDKYLAERSDYNARKAYENWQNLVESAETLREAPVYQSWLKEEKQRLVNNWRNTLLSKLENTILETGSPQPDAIVRVDSEQALDSLIKAEGDDEKFSHVRQSLRNTQADRLQTLTGGKLSSREIRHLEIMASWYWPMLGQDCRNILWMSLKDTQSVSQVGIRLRCLLAMENKEVEDGITFLREYIETREDVDRKLLKTVIPMFMMDWRQFNARPWRQPFPSFNDFLEQLYHLGLSGSL